MDRPGEPAPIHYEVERVPHGLQRFTEAGQLGLLQLVTVIPPPAPNGAELRSFSLRTGVVVSEHNKTEDTAIYVIKTNGQSVIAMNRLSKAIRGFRAFLNAAEDPEGYAAVMYPSDPSSGRHVHYE
jgi:hypothetical protein